jgi:hypothetical protein
MRALPKPIHTRLREERGMALVMALAISMVLSLGAASVVVYTTSNQKSAHRNKATSEAFHLAEAGLSRGLAILSNPSNNSLLTNTATPLLPGSGSPTVDTSYGTGRTVKWYGTFTQTGFAGGYWRVVGIGEVTSPTVPGGIVKRQVRALVPVSPASKQDNSTDSWSYIYAKHTGSECDMTFTNNSDINASIYAAGNFCLVNPTSLSGPASATAPQVKLYVKGYLKKSKQVNIGSSAQPLSVVGLQNGCYDDYSFSTNLGTYYPAASCGSARKIYPTASSTVPNVIAPTADFAAWYPWASPGPNSPCITGSNAPPFDDDVVDPSNPLASKDNGLTSVVDLAPTTSYTCQTATGELSWNASTGKLTIDGTVYIDGSAKVEGKVVDYDGYGALYLSGTFLVKNAWLCGKVLSGACDTMGWLNQGDDRDVLVVSAEQQGLGGSTPQSQVPAGDSIQIGSAEFQGALYGRFAVEMSQSSKMQGPVVSDTTIFNQTGGSPFPVLAKVPFGTPGNPIVTFELSAPLNELECGTVSTPC